MESRRLSELAGIRTHSGNAARDYDAELDALDAGEATELEAAAWPLNLVLLALGGAILGTAFYFLDPQDNRWLYNPWTYALATPLALGLLSFVLNGLVSRLIKRSMQLALLLSVLIHLILMVCAVNVVILSRMWPNVLDSLAQQREQLKREALQAKQYYRLSHHTQTGHRPDYLKHVATEHQPTEIPDPVTDTLTLARSQRVNLVSPTPKFELFRTPHMLERDKPATTLPSQSELVASLSRSEVSLPARPLASTPTLPSSQQFEDSPAVEMAPSLADLSRESTARSRRTEAPIAPAATPPTPHLSPTPTVARRERSEPLVELAPSAAAPLRRSREIAAPPTASGTVEQVVDSATLSPVPQPEPTEALEGSRQQRSQPSRQARTLPPDSLAALPNLPSPAARPPASQNVGRLAEVTTATPLSEQPAMNLPRQSAGGRTGLAASGSIPVLGPQDWGTEQTPIETEPRAAVELNAKRGTLRRAESRLTLPGSLGGPQWTGTPKLSSGDSPGKSPADLRQADAGPALSTDVAGLSGAQRDLQRSSIGLTGPAIAGPLTAAVPSETPAADEPGESSADTDLIASSSDIGRGRSRPGDSEVAGGLGSVLARPEDRLDSSLAASPSSLRRTDTGLVAGTTPARPQNLPSRSDPSSADMVPSAAITSDPIEVPAGAPQVTSSQPSSSLPVDVSATAVLRQRRAPAPEDFIGPPPSSLLDIEQPLGSGGISPAIGQMGPLLARREVDEQRWTPPQIESQRFARQDVGGLLGAGQNVSVPKPAFQQRLDRLQDRDARDPSTLEPQTELAIERGLAFLAKNQRPDGSWRLQDFDTPVLMRSDTAATGLALLAFQGAGYTHERFKYAAVVDKAIKFLIGHQARNGDLYIPQDPASDQNAWLYSHGIAALAMCEAYGMTQDEALRPAAQAAVDFMVASQDPQLGGWRYRPGVGADTSVTGWFMMAFKSGQLAGLNVPPATFARIERYVNASQASQDQPHLYRYNPFAADTPQQRHGLQPTSVMTSVGLLMRLYFGWQRDRPEMMAGADYLLENLPRNGTVERSARDTYYWYYATQVMFHMRGSRWQQWHDRLYPLLINSQVTEGEFAGSWHPNSPTPDLWARYGGRLYVTTLNLLSLEVSYRHLPLYEATAQ